MACPISVWGLAIRLPAMTSPRPENSFVRDVHTTSAKPVLRREMFKKLPIVSSTTKQTLCFSVIDLNLSRSGHCKRGFDGTSVKRAQNCFFSISCSNSSKSLVFVCPKNSTPPLQNSLREHSLRVSRYGNPKTMDAFSGPSVLLLLRRAEYMLDIPLVVRCTFCDPTDVKCAIRSLNKECGDVVGFS